MTDAHRGVAADPEHRGAAATTGPGEDPGNGAGRPPWRDTSLRRDARVADLLGRMSLEEKAAQIVAYWPAPASPGEQVAPHQAEFSRDTPPLPEVVRQGLGGLTRVFGTAPVSPGEGVERLRALQATVADGNRFGIPALAHEECLTGFTAHTATVFPAPLAWGATFDAPLVEEMAAAIGASMRRVGIHQGLSPVLDVTVDPRWGRTEETIGEDPYLVGQVGAAYVRGLEGAGVVATLKHFAGYSASQAARNLAPAAVGPRTLADVLVEPFVTALREGGARAVMHSYADVDGVPAAADESLLTGVLRDDLGFDGVVVADYFGISFLETLHGVAGSPAEAAALALRAGVDMELPSVRCYGQPLVEAVRRGEVAESHVDRAAARVLTLKCALGLLDETWQDALDDDTAGAGTLTHLDPPPHRDLARRVAEESVVLLGNDGVLPLDPGTARVAAVGPLTDDPAAMLGCYTFPGHVGVSFPDQPVGVTIPTLAEALREALPDATLTVRPGCGVDDDPPDGGADDALARAVEAARAADVAVVALGDRAGIFGRGTSGEGCDVESLHLPGRQEALAEAVLDTGTPTVLVLLAGRPYALGRLADRAAAVVQTFFPGEEGGAAVAGVLTGRVAPSGRLPVSVPRTTGGQPATYLHAPLAGRSEVSTVDPTPLYPFGHGLTWTRFTYETLAVAPGPEPRNSAAADGEAGGPAVPTDGTVRVRARVRNTGDRPGTEVVQLYLSDPVAQVVRPARWLAGWARVPLDPGCAATVDFHVHADRTSFTGLAGRRVVEPGRVDVAVGPSSGDLPLTGSFTLTGALREPGRDRVLTVPAEVTPG